MLFATIPAPVTRFILGKLHGALPPPPDDDPETLEARNQTALAAIARLAPMNAAEAELAVHAIASEAHANDALQDASRHKHDLKLVGQCRAQSGLMIRQAMQVRRELLRMQEVRQAAEDQHQQEIEAAERAAVEMATQTDETMPPPFMRRLAQVRQRAEGQEPSQNMRHSRPLCSRETRSAVPDGTGSAGDPDAVIRSSLGSRSADFAAA